MQMPSIKRCSESLDVSLSRLDRKQRLPILHRLPARRNPLHHLARHIGLNLVHQLHRFDDAEHLPDLHLSPTFTNGGAPGEGDS